MSLAMLERPVQVYSRESLMEKALRGALMIASLFVMSHAARDLAQYFSESDLFMIKNVAIHGNCLLTDEEICQAMDLPSVVHLWELDSASIEKRIQQLPLVLSADLDVVFPNALLVRLEERKPVFAWYDGKTGKTFLIDNDAIILGEKDALESRGFIAGMNQGSLHRLPYIIGAAEGPYDVGGKLPFTGADDALHAINLLSDKKTEWISQLEEIRAPVESHGWILRGAPIAGDIILGKENIRERIMNVATVINFLKREAISVEHIDLRFENQGALIKPKELAPEQWIEITRKYSRPDMGGDAV